jgi:hypothetical protein
MKQWYQPSTAANVLSTAPSGSRKRPTPGR